MPSAGGSCLRVAINGWFWDRPETGSGQYVRRVVDALAHADPELALNIFLPFELEGASDYASHSAPKGCRVHLISLPVARTNLAKLRWEQMTIPRVAHALGCDLLHIPYWGPPACAAMPTIVTVHDIIPRILPAYSGDLRVHLYTALVSAATHRAQLVLTDSHASQEDIVRYLRVKPQRVCTVPLAVGPEYTPHPGADDERILAGLDLPERYLLYLGGFDIRKNLYVALSAFQIVHQALPDATLVVGGRLPEADTSFAPDPRRIARDLDLPETAVRFLGFVPEEHKPALYRRARAFIFPSIYEGFGYPPLEAISCGTPVVASNASSLPEVVGKAGILLDPDDIEGMAGALIHLSINDHFHQELSGYAIEQAQSFSWTRTATQTLAAYRAVSHPSG